MNIPQQREKWNKIRQLGRQKYILQYWILGWGISTTLASIILQFFSSGANFHGFFTKDLLPIFCSQLIIMMVLGYGVGHFRWSQLERRFAPKKPTKKNRGIK